MASDALGAEEAKEKHRWGENRKVYTRKSRRPSENENSVAAATNQHTSTAVVTTDTINESENMVPRAKDATKDTDGAVTTAIEGGGTVDPPLNSQSSPAVDANSQLQQLTPPSTEMVREDLSRMNDIPSSNSQSSARDANSPKTEVVCDDLSVRHAEEFVNVPLLDSESSPANDTNSQTLQLNSPRSGDDDLNRQEEKHENAVQSSPDKDTCSLPQELTKDYNLNGQAGELENASLADSRSPPANVAITELHQLDTPKEDVVFDDTPNLNRQEGELQNALLPDSHSSPANVAVTELQQLDSPREDMVCDDTLNLNGQEGQLQNDLLPDSQSSPAKVAVTELQQLDSPREDMVCDDTPNLNGQAGELENASLPDSRSPPANVATTELQQLDIPRADVVCDDTPNLNRQEGQLQNASLPDSQSSPANAAVSELQQLDSLREDVVCDDTPSLSGQEGELQNTSLPDSRSSPSNVAVTELQQLDSPRADVVCDDTSDLNRQEGGLKNVTLRNSQSSPVKDVNSQSGQLDSSMAEAVHDDTSSLNRQEEEEELLDVTTVPDFRPSPVKNVNSLPEQLDLPITEVVHDGTQSLNKQEDELLNVTLPDSQSSPDKNIDSHSQQLHLPITEVACEDTSSLNRQEDEILNANLPISEPSPLTDINSQPVHLNLPTTGVVHDDTPSLNLLEGDELPNVSLPNSHSSPVKDVSSQPLELNLTRTDAFHDDAPNLNRQEGEILPNVALPDSQSSPVKDVNPQPVELNLTTDAPNLNRQEVEELPNVTLPDSQTSPLMEVNSQPVQLVLPTNEVAHDDMSSLNREEVKELPNVTHPNSQSSPVEDVNSHPMELNLTSEAVCDDTPNLNRREGEELPDATLPESSPLMEIQSESVQLILPTTEVARDDTSSLNRPEGELPNGDNIASAKSVVTRVGDKVNIRLSSSIPKQEARSLKRKLVSDLDQVRSLAKRLDTKEFQLFNGGLTNSAEIETGGATTGVVGQSLSQYSTSAVMGQGIGLNDSRPFRRLSVSVMDINRRGGSEIVEKEKRTPKANQFYQSSDFISGKERLPSESNKKQKSSSGRKKQSGGGSDFDKQIFKKCGTLLQQLMKHKFGWVFNTPVDVKGLCLHDYYDVIKHPMDLGTVKNRLSKNWYKSPLEFAEDVRLTFSNAMTYNPEGQDVHVMALELANIFEQKWVEIQAEYSRKLRYEGLYDVGLPTPQSRLTPLPFYGSPPPTNHSVPRPVYQEMKHLDRSESFSVPVDPRPAPVYSAPAGRTAAPKKPKAKDLNKRDMTYEEKQKLSTHLQDLPSEKLDSIVQIIKKRNPSLCQQDEEIEVDIDSVDAETLWELDRFVINYKKTLSKHKRKAELALQKAQAQKSIQADRDTLGTKSLNETTTRPGDAPSPPREGKQTDNASNSSSSSSSSSDSGSSSSDSDSDSSSASGSDGGQ